MNNKKKTRDKNRIMIVNCMLTLTNLPYKCTDQKEDDKKKENFKRKSHNR